MEGDSMLHAFLYVFIFQQSMRSTIMQMQHHVDVALRYRQNFKLKIILSRMELS